ncbi:hypothetical protein Vadar_003126 [Vaccinium darrowii]|uniref:Uncharacterized protein n=1 Tax=Vaccinium darrowii TaxID=229202 RepID=A0ACB7XMW9_9ERIC|nr:hypothetical protein Vadar_003126 [Vaccinium darrowii]
MLMERNQWKSLDYCVILDSIETLSLDIDSNFALPRGRVQDDGQEKEKIEPAPRRRRPPPQATTAADGGHQSPSDPTEARLNFCLPDSDSTRLGTDARRDLKAIPRLLITSSTGRKELPLLMIWGSIIRMVGAD